jgi:short subunit dehydrogenase-like uncharacterized protein
MKTDIILLGATGFTGSLIADELNKRNLSFQAYARNTEKLDLLKANNPNCIEALALNWDELNLGLNIQSHSLVINCIGPFNVYGSKIVDACILAGATYIDITGEQEIVKQSFESKHELSKKTGALIVHSMAFESALSDIMLSVAIQKMPADNFINYNTYYLLDSKQMSPGTRISMKVANAFHSYRLKDLELHSLLESYSYIPQKPDPIEPYSSVPVGYPEVIFAKSYGTIENSCSHYLVESNSDLALLWKSKAGMHKNEIDVSAMINRHDNLKLIGPSAEERLQQKFEIHTYLTSEINRFKQVLMGYDMYGLTAELVVTAVSILISPSSKINAITGVCTPSQILRSTGEHFISNHSNLKLHSKLLKINHE